MGMLSPSIHKSEDELIWTSAELPSVERSGLSAAVMRCCSVAAKYKCCGVAVLRSEGSRDESRGKRQEAAVGRVREKCVLDFSS